MKAGLMKAVTISTGIEQRAVNGRRSSSTFVAQCCFPQSGLM